MAAMEFCGQWHATSQVAMSYPLLMADVNLAIAYNQAANPSVSQNSRPVRDQEALEKELARLVVEQQEGAPVADEAVSRVKKLILRDPEKFLELARGDNREQVKKYVDEHLSPWFEENHPELFEKYQKAQLGQIAP
jgi:hypothetical protein